MAAIRLLRRLTVRCSEKTGVLGVGSDGDRERWQRWEEVGGGGGEETESERQRERQRERKRGGRQAEGVSVFDLAIDQ